MATYTFTAFGETRRYEADNDMGIVFEKGEAMGQANKDLLWNHNKFIEDSNGTWMERGRFEFEWVVGNFFD